MDMITKVSKLAVSIGVLLLAVSAFIFVLRYDSTPAQGVGIYKERSLAYHNVYTQSADGKIMYRWFYNKNNRQWERVAFSKAAR